MSLSVELAAVTQALDDAELEARRPAVRALLVSKLSALLAECESRVGSEDRQDARWAELAVRIIRDLAGIYRLGVAAPAEVDEDDVATVSEAHRSRLIDGVSRDLDELAGKAQL